MPAFAVYSRADWRMSIAGAPRASRSGASQEASNRTLPRADLPPRVRPGGCRERRRRERRARVSQRDRAGDTMSGVLLRGGRVYAPAGPPATALLVDGPTVGWVGADPADAAAAADTVVDLDGALITPAFVDAHVHATS